MGIGGVWAHGARSRARILSVGHVAVRVPGRNVARPQAFPPEHPWEAWDEEKQTEPQLQSQKGEASLTRKTLVGGVWRGPWLYSGVPEGPWGGCRWHQCVGLGCHPMLKLGTPPLRQPTPRPAPTPDPHAFTRRRFPTVPHRVSTPGKFPPVPHLVLSCVWAFRTGFTPWGCVPAIPGGSESGPPASSVPSTHTAVLLFSCSHLNL